ncbi:twitching motility protein PilT [Methyloprofundus sedimenti]|uniref:Twitching motility protein PilT n=1 Tax=Methyloprofundus sedimenti TaxID=1420851 RepID=A0A1V8M4B7_9GAMM|nr:type II toxin-antitoxin system VapC family toxin [Methyloprofundus sedimenti]OQK16243.1 twitching motility protein PilT [Methyloprofundus sedimenti]
MLTICDTHVLIFWQDAPNRLSSKATQAIENSLATKSLACSDISFWEIAMLFKAGRLRNDVPAEQYMNDIILAMTLNVLPVTPQIATLSQQGLFIHKDPADRLIASTAIVNNAPLISADTKLQNIDALSIIW